MITKNVTKAPQVVRRGFTLIELLVVVSIIALLVSILMPALGKAREQAKNSVCKSNLKQLATAFYYYVEKYNTFPAPTDNNVSMYYACWTKQMIGLNYWQYHFYGFGASPSSTYHHVALKDGWSTRYVGDFEGMACPADKGDLLRYWPQTNMSYYDCLGTSYWYNCRDLWGGKGGDDTALGGLLSTNYSKLRQPAFIAVLGDPEMFALNDFDAPRWRWHDKDQNYANIAFADFHVAGIICDMTTYNLTWTMNVPK
jgi:prepilin-type N-terminal cleavage/methylation domain-containing protein/prepilin-type processing-associated H-X9-DG protein